MLRITTKKQGFSLIELLITLFVLAILLVIAVPSFNALIQKTRVNSSTNLFVSYYQLARNTAISTRHDTIYCPIDITLPSLTGQKCAQDWTLGAVVYKDANGNLTIDSDQDVVALVNKPHKGLQMRMRAGLNKQYLRFQANGFLENTAGNLVICGADNNPRHAKTVIFTRNGRLRFGTDNNKDGILENAEGQPISCPP